MAPVVEVEHGGDSHGRVGSVSVVSVVEGGRRAVGRGKGGGRRAVIEVGAAE